jgi:hypothetical protein
MQLITGKKKKEKKKKLLLATIDIPDFISSNLTLNNTFCELYITILSLIEMSINSKRKP